MAQQTKSDNVVFDKSNPFSSNKNNSKQQSVISSEMKSGSKDVMSTNNGSSTTAIKLKSKSNIKPRGRRASVSYDDLEGLQFVHLQNECKTGSNYTSSMIRLLGKLCDGYDKFGKNLTNTVDQEINFIHKYASSIHNESTFLSSFQFLCSFLKDLAINFNKIAFEVKSTMIDPLIEFQKHCDSKYNTIYKKHEQCYNKYMNDENHLNSYCSKYKEIINEEKNKFKLIQLLSASIMPSNDHKTIKKSWHSPSKTKMKVSNFIKKAKTKTKRISTARLSSLNLGGNGNHNNNNTDNEMEDDEEQKTASNNNNDNNIDIYLKNTKMEIERIQNDKKEHIPLLYAIYTYSNTRNKLIKHEERYNEQIESVNHSMNQYEYVRKETMKSMKKMEIERLIHCKKIYCTLTDIFNSDKFEITKHSSFEQFKQSIKTLVPDVEFNTFLAKSNENIKLKYIKPKPLIASSLLINWRTPYHLFEDSMYLQINVEKINRNTLKVPFIFEYLMENIESKSAINDPDIFMLNAISPKASHVEHTFCFKDGLMKTTDLMAIPVLTDQINKLYECTAINISDHHHAIILLKLWLFKCADGLLPYYLYDRICQFQLMNTVNERLYFVENEILCNLSMVRIYCLSRLINICKKIVREQNQITIIDLSYELSNILIRNPNINNWRQLNVENNGEDDNIDNKSKLKLMLDPQSTYKLPLAPSHRNKRAEMAFITYLLSNHISILNDKKIVNYGTKLSQFKKHNDDNKLIKQSKTELAKMKKQSIDYQQNNNNNNNNNDSDKQLINK